jgi:AmmeMemoRadiSam system protein A
MVEVIDRTSTLIGIAREAIATRERPLPRPSWPDAWLGGRAASFVTLRLDEDLRGCIGTVDAHRALGDDVAHNAFCAAYRDPRFEPVAEVERRRLVVEISVLSARAAMHVATEEEALAAMRPGIDGIYLEYNGLTSTFLPQVWESLPDPLDFLCELRRKAGLPRRFWREDVKLSRYTVEKFK